MEQLTINEIKNKIYIEGLKSIISYYEVFKYQSPINETTNETLEFEEWFKTIKIDPYYSSKLPRYITDNLGNIAIKELFKDYLYEIYEELLTEKGEEIND